MKKVLTVFAAIILAVNLFTIESKITSVTVYSDRAHVTRTATSNFTKGNHKIVFEHLPAKIDASSIQVDGKGSAVIKNVAFKTEHTKEIANDKKRTLNEKLQTLKDNRKILNDELNLAKDEKKATKDILAKLTNPAEETENLEIEPTNWIKMLDWYHAKNASLDKMIQDKNIEMRSLNADIDQVQRQINDLGSGLSKIKEFVEVDIEVKENSDLELNFSYIVYGPRWFPQYDLRVDSDQKKINIIYKGIITQKTGEDWNNVDIKLSTARPNIGAEHPELEPFYIKNKKNYRLSVDMDAVGKTSVAPGGFVSEYGGAEGMSNTLKIRGGRQNEVAYTVDAMNAKQDLEVYTSNLTSGATSAVFDIDGINTIPANNEEQQVTIAILNYDADFRYSTVPKLNQFAYLKAKVSNQSDYPFIAGQANVFLDNSFVTSSKIDAVAPGEDFWTFLGVDESIKVEYKLVKKLKEKIGMFEAKNRITNEYIIEITNDKKTDEEIVVWDQLPISENEDIEVKLIEPKYKEDTDDLKMTEENFLEWFFVLKPGEKIEIPFKYSIDYPRNYKLQGF